MLGRLSLNPAVHVDVVGTIVFPLIALMTGVPLIGWAKPVPVNMRNLREPRRDFAIVALAGPVSNLMLAVIGAVVVNLLPPGDGAQIGLVQEGADPLRADQRAAGGVQHDPDPAARRRERAASASCRERMAAGVEQLRSWGFVLLYVLMLSGFLSAITFPVQRAILNWLL